MSNAIVSVINVGNSMHSDAAFHSQPDRFQMIDGFIASFTSFAAWIVNVDGELKCTECSL